MQDLKNITNTNNTFLASAPESAPAAPAALTIKTVTDIPYIPAVQQELALTINGEAFVLQYTPTVSCETILDAVQWVINLVLDDRGYISYPLLAIAQDLAIVNHFTRLSIFAPAVQKGEMSPGEQSLPQGQSLAAYLYETYDILFQADIFSQLKRAVNQKQLEMFYSTTEATLQSIVEYANSAKAVLKAALEAPQGRPAQMESLEGTQGAQAALAPVEN